ncbi:MAG TPA: S-layer homology domain-containing protein [Kamptonema sp.]|nr:S-layer homology domain-containing protein [Kamptonema sp.]
MASPQPPSPENNPLGFDECIAIAVAFSAIAAIFFWSVAKNGNQINIVNAPSPPTSPQLSPTPEKLNVSKPIPPNLAQPSPTVTISPSASPAQTQTRTIPFFSSGSNIASQPATIPSVPLPATRKPQPNPTKIAVIPAKVNSAAQPASTKVTPIKFSDVPDRYWARIFIERLAERKIITGFSDGKFQPEQPVTRAELAAIIEGIATNQKVAAQKSVNFKDVKSQNWAASAIAKSVGTGYLKGYPGNAFRPDQLVPRVQVLAALASGLNLKPPTKSAQVLEIYKDSKQVPSWATERVAAATQANLVVNYPKRELLNPNQPATRADVAAMVYQALVKLDKAKPLNSDYIVQP